MTSKNVEVVIVRGYRRIYARGLVFVVRSRNSAFYALAFDVVGDKEIDILDRIEGHPETYERTCIEVERLSGERITTWIYIPTPMMIYRFGINERKDDPEDSFIKNIINSGSAGEFPLLAEKIR